MKNTVLLVVFLMLGGLVLIMSGDTEPEAFSPVAVDTLADAHGFSVDLSDKESLYIANHNGLYRLLDEATLERISEAQHDFMGFAAHPADPKVMYASGHPKTGGNLGVLKSTDGGQTFEKISDGAQGPVDFHAMTISDANPLYLYGSYTGTFQRSIDGGVTWEITNGPANTNIISLTADVEDQDTVYASTSTGIFVSTDAGDSWEKYYGESAVIAFAINPNNPSERIASFAESGLLRSIDDGESWNQMTSPSESSVPVLYIDFAGDESNTVFALLQDLSIHSTTNEGATWKTIHKN